MFSISLCHRDHHRQLLRGCGWRLCGVWTFAAATPSSTDQWEHCVHHHYHRAQWPCLLAGPASWRAERWGLPGCRTAWWICWVQVSCRIDLPVHFCCSSACTCDFAQWVLGSVLTQHWALSSSLVEKRIQAFETKCRKKTSPHLLLGTQNPTTGCGARATPLWTHRSLFWQLSRNENLYDLGMSHCIRLSKTILQGTLEGDLC